MKSPIPMMARRTVCACLTMMTLMLCVLLIGCGSGESAYDIAVRHGFVGTEEEWLLSLRADGGQDSEGTEPNETEPVRSIVSVQIDSRGHLLITFSDGSSTDAGQIKEIAEGEDSVAYPDEAGYTSVLQTVYATSPVNIRTKPSSEEGSSVVGQLRQGEKITRIGINEQAGWSRVVWGGNVRYVSSRYLELTVSDTVMDIGETAPVVLLPDSVTVTVGEAYSLHTDAFVSGLTENMYVSYDYHGSETAQVMSRADSYTLTEMTAGNYTLDVTITTYLDGALVTIYRKTVTILAVDAQEEMRLTGLLLGDSRISDGTIISALQIALGSRLTLVGTKTAATCPSEGRSGWSTANYLNYEKVGQNENPFYNPELQTDAQTGLNYHFDFSHYMKQTGAAVPDFVVICIGANDGYTAASVDNIRIMAESILAYGKSVDKEISVLIMTEYLCPSVGYAVAQDVNVAAKRYAQSNHFSYMTAALGEREEDGIYLLSNHLVLDGLSHRVADRVDGEIVITDLAHLSYDGYIKQSEVILSYLYRIFGE
ncbi:MAG: SH3 domain-containing protein [Clostridia bacterium]|nr:SH3 domain-containing protein [Clostridia bacterium]